MSEEQPRSEIAMAALAQVRALLDDWEGTDWSHTNPVREIDHILTMAYGRLRMAGMKRDRRNARWLARITSYTFPRTLKNRLGPDEASAVCFTVDITDGAKSARGRRVEIRMSAKNARLLGRQMAEMGLVTGNGPQIEDISEDELLEGGSLKEEDET